MTIRPAKSSDLPFFRRLYREAFPRSERKPVSMLRREVKRGRMEMLILCEGDAPVGLIVTAICAEPVLIDYFAIEPSMRGRGLGSHALDAIRSYYGGKPLFLEIEAPDPAAPNQAQRLSRKRFYERCGFLDTGHRVRLMGIPMELLSSAPVTRNACRHAYEVLYGKWVGRIVKLEE
ncbi:MAG: GNAT family N-acetyltransferase [Oscillospiraceae bacterium]|nr:GNAT family N-acetyltransferase [Oscillospiraceae bacterium]